MLLLREVDFGVELPAGVRLRESGGCVERLAAAAAARDGDPNRGGFGGGRRA